MDHILAAGRRLALARAFLLKTMETAAEDPRSGAYLTAAREHLSRVDRVLRKLGALHKKATVQEGKKRVPADVVALQRIYTQARGDIMQAMDELPDEGMFHDLYGLVREVDALGSHALTLVGPYYVWRGLPVGLPEA